MPKYVLLLTAMAMTGCSAGPTSNASNDGPPAQTSAALTWGRPWTPGVVSGTAWFLRNSNSQGNADRTFVYGFAGGIPLAGDWDGDGNASPGMYDPSTQAWYLRNSDTQGAADVPVFQYGFPGGVPVVGDWDGNGTWTVGMYDPRTQVWYLRNSNNWGYADIPIFQYGFAGGVPVVGDWDGNGSVTVGMYNPSWQGWYLRNSNNWGYADIPPFQYGFPNGIPIVGDWNGEGFSRVGMYDPAGAGWYIRYTNTQGVADTTFVYGNPGATPLTGHWTPIPPPPPPPSSKVSSLIGPSQTYTGEAFSVSWNLDVVGGCTPSSRLTARDLSNNRIIFDQTSTQTSGSTSIAASTPAGSSLIVQLNTGCTNANASTDSKAFQVDVKAPPVPVCSNGTVQTFEFCGTWPNDPNNPKTCITYGEVVCCSRGDQNCSQAAERAVQAQYPGASFQPGQCPNPCP